MLKTPCKPNQWEFNAKGVPTGMPFRALSVLLLASLFIVGCHKPEEDEPEQDFDRAALLTRWADGIIVPGYASWKSDVSVLRNSLVAMQNDPTVEQLLNAREALHRARLSWQTVSLFDFGPALSQGLMSVANVYPCDTEQIQENFGNPINLETPANLAAGGFETLDYLLFDPSVSANAHLETLTQEALDYAVQIADLLTDKAETVSEAWNTDYRDTFVASTGTDVGSGLGMMLNAFNRMYEGDVRKNKLGLPSGAMTFSMTPLPDHVEGAYSQTHSIAYILASLEACNRVFRGINTEGDDGTGLDDYLIARDATHLDQSLTDAINTQWEAAVEAVENLPGPLNQAVVSDQQSCLDAYAEMQQLVVLYKVDMMSSLGVLITYQDNDGD